MIYNAAASLVYVGAFLVVLAGIGSLLDWWEDRS